MWILTLRYSDGTAPDSVYPGLLDDDQKTLVEWVRRDGAVVKDMIWTRTKNINLIHREMDIEQDAKE